MGITSTSEEKNQIHKISYSESQITSDSLFCNLETAVFKDFVQESLILYKNNKAKQKVNLAIGVYKDDDQRPYVFEVVRKVEKTLFEQFEDHEYLDIDGHPQFIKGARKILFGESKIIESGRIVSVQTISGTGAVNTVFSLIAEYLPNKQVFVPNQTWPLHKSVPQKMKIKWGEYPYYNSKTRSFDQSAMIAFLETVDRGSVILLHACAHNPTGVDPNENQWRNIASVMKKKGLIPFFDVAYQGFASGDIQKDAWAVRHFQAEGFQMFLAQSFSKNMGLYGERVGALHVVLNDKIKAKKLLSHLIVMIRRTISSPCKYGAVIAAKILNDPLLFEQWKIQLKQVVLKRILSMRLFLKNQLQRIGAPGSWNHIIEQKGMFSFTGLSQNVCNRLINNYNIYMSTTGRISIPGITTKNVGYLASSIKKAIQESN